MVPTWCPGVTPGPIILPVTKGGDGRLVKPLSSLGEGNNYISCKRYGAAAGEG